MNKPIKFYEIKKKVKTKQGKSIYEEIGRYEKLSRADEVIKKKKLDDECARLYLKLLWKNGIESAIQLTVKDKKVYE